MALTTAAALGYAQASICAFGIGVRHPHSHCGIEHMNLAWFDLPLLRGEGVLQGRHGRIAIAIGLGAALVTKLIATLGPVILATAIDIGGILIGGIAEVVSGGLATPPTT